MGSNNDLISNFDDISEESLIINIQKIPALEKGCLVILKGYIDTYNSTFFQTQVDKIINVGFTNLIFECSSLTSISSTGFGILTSFLKKTHILGGEIVLAVLQPTIIETIELLGFAHFFKMVNTLEEAMRILGAVNGSIGTAVFPKLLTCPSCHKSLRAQHAGRFRCINCKTILMVAENGTVSAEN